LKDALGAMTYILSRTNNKARAAAGLPKKFLGSEALEAAGASTLVARVWLAYDMSVFIYNGWKDSEKNKLIDCVNGLDGNRIAVTTLVWDTGSIEFSVGTW